MRWEPIIIGPLLLSAACGGDAGTGDAESSATDPMSDPAEATSAEMASAEATDPNTSTGAADPQSTSEMSADVDTSATESNGSESTRTDGTDLGTSTMPSGVETTGMDGATTDDERSGVDNAGMDNAGAEDSGESQPSGTSDDSAEPETAGSQTGSNSDVASSEPDTETAASDPDPDTAENESDVNLQPDQGMDAMSEGAGDEPEPATDAETLTQLSFAADIWPLWSKDRDPVFVYRGMDSYTGCSDETSPCHGAANPGALLSMADAETAYAQMMDTQSVSGICAGTQRVAIGDPEQSCLILFYEGRLGPLDLDWVDEAEIELMREWIRQGALP